jgi:uncharacterized protein (DUF885 family)
MAANTGIHALVARRVHRLALATARLPAALADAEVDRYIANPGQALNYGVRLPERCACARRTPR